jgi:hypothetical protein
MLTLCERGSYDRLMMSFGLWGVFSNFMNCFELGFDRSRGFGSARGQFWPIAIDRPTRPNNIASITVQQMMAEFASAVHANWPLAARWLSSHFECVTRAQQSRTSAVCVCWFFNDAVTTGRLASVGHSVESTPTNGRRFTALSLPWWVTHPSTNRGQRALTAVKVTELPLVATAPLVNPCRWPTGGRSIHVTTCSVFAAMLHHAT